MVIEQVFLLISLTLFLSISQTLSLLYLKLTPSFEQSVVYQKRSALCNAATNSFSAQFATTGPSVTKVKVLLVVKMVQLLDGLLTTCCRRS